MAADFPNLPTSPESTADSDHLFISLHDFLLLDCGPILACSASSASIFSTVGKIPTNSFGSALTMLVSHCATPIGPFRCRSAYSSTTLFRETPCVGKAPRRPLARRSITRFLLPHCLEPHDLFTNNSLASVHNRL